MRGGAEALSQFLRAAQRAVHDIDLDAALLEGVDRRACRAAGTEDQRIAPGYVPARRAIVEIGDEAVDIGVAAHEALVLEPERVHCADRMGRLVGFLNEAKRGLLVRRGDVAPDVAVLP